MEAGRIIARQLYDYDNGRSYGLGVNLSKAVDSRGNLKYGVSIPVEYGFDERNRDILPTIGFGSDVAAETSVIGTLNRDVSRHVGCTDSKRASLDAKLPASDIADVMMAGYKAHVVRKDQITGVAAGDAPMVDPEYGDEEEEEFDGVVSAKIGAEDRRGKTRVYASHEEVVTVNPQVGEMETDYVIKTHYRTIAFEESKDPSSFEQSVSAGHIYYELVDLSSGTSNFFSAYPEEGSIVYGDLELNPQERDIFQHEKTLEYMQKTGKNVLFSKVMHVTKEQFDKADEFASNLKGKYVLGGQDCSDVGPRLFEELGMSTAHYAHLFKDRELSKTPVGLKIKGAYGHRSAELTFKGTSREDVAERYHVSVDRVQKKYDIKPEDLKHFNEDIAYNNMCKDQEYVILPVK